MQRISSAPLVLLWAVLTTIAHAEPPREPVNQPTREGCRASGSILSYSGRDSPLYAVEREDFDRLDELLCLGADPEKKGQAGWRALHVAAMDGHTEAVRSLIEFGAEIDPKDIHGRTPLFLAAQREHIAAVRLLLEAGADPNDAETRRALYSALSDSNEELLALLLDAGAEMEGDLLLSHAIQRGDLEIVQVLIDRGVEMNPDQDQNRSYCSSPLGSALWKEHWEIARLLLEAGADPNACDDPRSRPLYIAARQGREDIVRELFSAGANRTGLAEGRLLYAAERGDAGGVWLALQHGADLDLLDSSNQDDPLHLAAASGDERTVRVLLKHGAVFDDPNWNGETPLMNAAKQGSLAIVNVLLGMGAEIDREDRLHRTPILHAAEGGHLEIILDLVSRGANPNHVSVWDDRTDLITSGVGSVIDVLIDNGHEDKLEPLMQKVGDRFDLDVLVEVARTCRDRGRPEVVHPLFESRPELSQAVKAAEAELAAILSRHKMSPPVRRKGCGPPSD